jgi:hypothetical protein
LVVLQETVQEAVRVEFVAAVGGELAAAVELAEPAEKQVAGAAEPGVESQFEQQVAEPVESLVFEDQRSARDDSVLFA